MATSISSLGSASITGLYIIVLVTVGAYFRSFLVPDVTTIMYVTLPDPLPILELICGLIMSVFRSNELLMRLTRANALFGVIQRKDELYNPVNPYASDSEHASSLLPLITYVIKNMQIL